MNVDDLVTLRQIEDLKYRYLRSLDHKDWDLFATVFTDDATAVYGSRLAFTGPGDIVSYMRENLGPTMITLHQCHHPEIVLDGDQATGTWSLQDRVIMTEHRLVLDGMSTYHDRYERDHEGIWRIAHTGYERIFESIVSFDDMPSFKLMYNKWA